MAEHLYKGPQHPERANGGCKTLSKHIPKGCLQNANGPTAAGERLLQERLHTSCLQPCSAALTHVKTLEFFHYQHHLPHPPILNNLFQASILEHVLTASSWKSLPKESLEASWGMCAFQACRIGLQLSAMLSRFGSHYCLPLA